MNAIQRIQNPFANITGDVIATPRNAAETTEHHRAVAEVQASLMISKLNPRDPIKATERILNACTRPKLAESALYSYSRAGTEITGPSIRLAEAIAQNWGNLQFGIRELDQRPGVSTVEAFCWDTETNVRQSKTFQVKHERKTKNRGTYALDDPRDIYEMVANNGARRLRACILGVVPGDIIEAAQSQCEETLKATADTSPENIKKLLDAFVDFSVTKKQIERKIQRNIESIQPAQVIQLRKIYNSMKEGMSVASDWFDPIEGVSDETKTKAEKIVEQMEGVQS